MRVADEDVVLAKVSNRARHTTADGAHLFEVAPSEATAPSAARTCSLCAKALADAMLARGMSLVTGGTENHLLLVDLTNRNIGGRSAARALNQCGVELNANSIPFDPRKPFDPSGIRIGLAALTSRGMTESSMPAVAAFIDDGVQEAAKGDGSVPDDFAAKMRAQVKEFLSGFSAPGL